MNVELPLAWIESILAYAVPSLQARKRVVGLGIGTRAARESAVLALYVWFRFCSVEQRYARKMTVLNLVPPTNT